MPYNVESFNLDHTKVHAPYIRVAGRKVGMCGDYITKFDIRLCQPNKTFMETGALHAIEHLFAETIRDVLDKDSVIDFSPMGCRTGFYLTLFGNLTENDILSPILSVFNTIANWDKDIPAQSEKECGNYKDLNLAGAKALAKAFIEGIKRKGPNAFEEKHSNI